MPFTPATIISEKTLAGRYQRNVTPRSAAAMADAAIMRIFLVTALAFSPRRRARPRLLFHLRNARSRRSGAAIDTFNRLICREFTLLALIDVEASRVCMKLVYFRYFYGREFS